MENEGIASDGEAAPVAAEAQVNEAPAVTNEAPARSEPTSRRDALDRAFEAVEKQATEQVETPAEKPKADRNRNPDGTFAPGAVEKAVEAAAAAETPVPEVKTPAESFVADDAPGRFSADAKAAWKDAPPALKGEVKRALGELENGLTQYRERLAPYQGMEQFAQMAQESGKNVAEVFNAYYQMEQSLRRDPVNTVGLILQRVGVSPHQYASMILNQDPNQVQVQNDQVVYGLQQQVSQLQSHIQRMMQDADARETAEAQRIITEFKSNKPRFDEFRNDIHFFLSHGKASTLDEAYQLAERLNPGPAPAVTPQPAPAPATAAPAIPAAQTRKAALSVTGAPAAGSNPALRKAPSTRRGALDSAFNALGIAS